MRLVVQWSVPFNRHVGIRVVAAAPDSSRIVLHLPLRQRNLNAAGIVHGAALFALAEAVHGVAVLWQFPPSHHRMFTKCARIEFLARTRGDLFVSFGLAESTRRDIQAALEAWGRAEVTLQARVEGNDGHVVATLCATYVVLRRHGAPPHADRCKPHGMSTDESAPRPAPPVDRESPG